MGKLENIIEKLENYKKDHEAKAKAWEGVTLEKKKSGEEFAQIGRGLTGGAKLQYPFYENSLLHPQITIYTQTNHRTTEDKIDIFLFLDEHPEKAEGHEIRTEGSIHRATVILTPDEIREAIKTRAEWHKQQVNSYNAQILAAKKAFTAYQKAIEKAENELKANSGCAGEMFGNSLYFAVKENVK